MNGRKYIPLLAVIGACVLWSTRAAAHFLREAHARHCPGLQRRIGQHADSIAAGREYVSAYVEYVHFVESVHRLAESGAAHTHHEAE